MYKTVNAISPKNEKAPKSKKKRQISFPDANPTPTIALKTKK